MGDNELLHELFRRVYRVSSPPANYDELLENAEVNERGQKVIPFDDYECSIDVMEEVLKQFFIDYNITSEWDKRRFSYSYWLGPTPKTKKSPDMGKKITKKLKL